MPQENIPNPQNTNNYNEKLPEELAYQELGPKDKPPQKIPVLKIIVYFLVFSIFLIIILTATLLILNQKKPFNFASQDALISEFLTPESLISEAPVSPAPTPTPNPCGNTGRLCPNGEIIEKQGPSCEFPTCPDDRNVSLDMTSFWAISETENSKFRKYVNHDIDYSFDAPVNWRFVGRDVGANLFSSNYKCKNGDTDCTGANILLLSSITTNKTNAADWLSSKDNFIFPNAKKNTTSLPRLNIGGVEAVKVKDAGTSETYVFIYNDTVFMLSYGASNGTDARAAKKVFDHIVSTFQTKIN